MLNARGFSKGGIPIIDKNKVIDVMADSIVNTAKALSKSYEEAKPKVGIVMQIPSVSGDPYIVAVNKQNYSAYPLSTETYSIRQTVLVFIVKNGSKNFIIGGTSDHTPASYTSLSDIPSAFTPTSHTHGNITNDGKVGTDSGKYLVTGTGGLVQTGMTVGEYALKACCATGSEASLALTSGTVTQIALATLNPFNDSTLFSISDGGVKVSVAGNYMISGSAYIGLTTVANTAIGRNASIYKNATEIVNSGDYSYNTGTNGTVATGVKIVTLAANDILYLKVRSANTAGTAYPNHSSTYLTIVKI